MNYRTLFLSLLAASAAFGQNRISDALKIWFRDDTAVEIRTESTNRNSTLLSTSGAVMSAREDFRRIVIDKNGKTLFSYDIEGRKGARGIFTLRIKPVDSESVPTLAAARDFPPLRVGDEVQVDILLHPQTGERIYDVLRVSGQPRPVIQKPKPAGDQLSFQEVRVVLNGKTIHEPENSWIIGAAAMLYLPGKGSYYLSLAPSTEYPFQAAGWVDHAILRFKHDGDLVEVYGKSNVLQKSDYGTVWVYHEPGMLVMRAVPEHKVIVTHPVPGRPFEIQTADQVEWLIPKKKKQE